MPGYFCLTLMYILKLIYFFFYWSMKVPSWEAHFCLCWFTLGLFSEWVQTCKYKHQENVWLDSQSTAARNNIIVISRQCPSSDNMLLLKCIIQNEAVLIFVCFSSWSMSISHEAMEDQGFWDFGITTSRIKGTKKQDYILFHKLLEYVWKKFFWQKFIQKRKTEEHKTFLKCMLQSLLIKVL